MWLRGGASAGSASQNAATASGEPSTSTSTPADVFSTHPRRPWRTAREYTNGRKPTPWTTPRTLMRAADERLPAHSGQRNWKSSL